MNKALEALESIKFGCCNFENRTLYKDEFEIIEKELKRLEMYEERAKLVASGNVIDINDIKLKALEIIKEKYVIPTFIANSESVEEYNRQLKQITFRKDYEIRKLTQKEYDLLKEIIG